MRLLGRLEGGRLSRSVLLLGKEICRASPNPDRPAEPPVRLVS